MGGLPFEEQAAQALQRRGSRCSGAFCHSPACSVSYQAGVPPLLEGGAFSGASDPGGGAELPLVNAPRSGLPGRGPWEPRERGLSPHLKGTLQRSTLWFSAVLALPPATSLHCRFIHCLFCPSSVSHFIVLLPVTSSPTSPCT